MREVFLRAWRKGVMAVLINRETGKKATPQELEACRLRANEILGSAYSSPEQLEWALTIPGVDMDLFLRSFESTRARGERIRKEMEQCS